MYGKEDTDREGGVITEYVRKILIEKGMLSQCMEGKILIEKGMLS